MKIIRYIFLALLLGTSSQGAGSSFGHIPDMPKIPPPSPIQFMNAFGARMLGSTVTFRSETPSGNPLIKKNTLFLFGLTPEIRQKLYQQSSCGVRDYEMVIVKVDDKHTYGISFNCANRCFAMAERVESRQLVGVSSPVDIPRSVCEGLWSGVVKFKEADGI